MCLGVCCDVELWPIESQMSVFICLMRGEYDDDLLWPFRGTIAFQLCNRTTDWGHLDYIIVYDDKVNDKIAGRVTDIKGAGSVCIA